MCIKYLRIAYGPTSLSYIGSEMARIQTPLLLLPSRSSVLGGPQQYLPLSITTYLAAALICIPPAASTTTPLTSTSSAFGSFLWLFCYEVHRRCGGVDESQRATLNLPMSMVHLPGGTYGRRCHSQTLHRYKHGSLLRNVMESGLPTLCDCWPCYVLYTVAIIGVGHRLWRTNAAQLKCTSTGVNQVICICASAWEVLHWYTRGVALHT